MHNPKFSDFNPSEQLRYHKNKRIIFGVIIIMVGLFILAKKLGAPFIHYPVWPFVLIVVGIISGIKHSFRKLFSWVLVFIGVVFLIPRFEIFGMLSTHLIVPAVFIGAGLYVILKPKRSFNTYRKFDRIKRQVPSVTSFDEDTISLEVAFGERTSIVTSKNFKGGIIETTCGTTKLNLLQADGTSPITIDVDISFGSLEVFVPSHWDVAFEVNQSVASVDDKRYIRTQTETPIKLILTGKCSFGNIIVRSI